jgi:beta-phosphoglucomutase-like phosphatase (HAD superfamily)
MPEFQGVIFDVDGVLVDSPHEKAWRQSLRELMESSWSDIRDRTTWTPDAFTAHVYQQYVSGKPRARRPRLLPGTRCRPTRRRVRAAEAGNGRAPHPCR